METKAIKGGVLHITTKRNLIPQWGVANFTQMNEDFVKSRSRSSKKFKRCFCCNWPFQMTGESMNLVHFKGHGNDVVCDDCYKKLRFEEGASNDNN